MAHEITETDGFFTVRQPAWHGLGVVLPDHPTREEAQAIAHPWEPITDSLYLQEPTITPHVHGEACGYGFMAECDLIDDVGSEFNVVDSHKLIRRSDNGAPIGVVGAGYEPVTNSEMWDIAEAIQGSGVDVKYETGGSLKGGSQVWLLLRLEEPIIVPGDPNGATIPYYSLQNSHDSSGSFRGQATMTRIVCANTSKIADTDARARGTEFTFRHTKNVGERIEGARMALGLWRQSLTTWQEHMDVLLDRKIATGYTVEDFLDKFIPAPPAGIVSERVQANIEKERDTWKSLYHGITGEGLEGTAYGLVQASVEYAEHYRRAHSKESRFKRTYLDRNALVQSATRIADVLTV